MGTHQDKRTRRVAGKQRRQLARQMMREIIDAPFITRLGFAWMVLKGRRKADDR